MRCALWRMRVRRLPSSARTAIESLSTQIAALLHGHLDAVTSSSDESAAGGGGVAPDPAIEHIPRKIQILHILDNLAGCVT